MQSETARRRDKILGDVTRSTVPPQHQNGVGSVRPEQVTSLTRHRPVAHPDGGSGEHARGLGPPDRIAAKGL
jgi:hypothetical protein